MAFQESKSEMTCPDCGAVHEVPWFRMPVKEWQALTCRACKGSLFRGNSVMNFGEPQLLRGNPN